MRAGQSENEFSPGFKTKNTRNFKKNGENRVSAMVTGGIPSEIMLKLYEGDLDMLYKLFWDSHMLLT